MKENFCKSELKYNPIEITIQDDNTIFRYVLGHWGDAGMYDIINDTSGRTDFGYSVAGMAKNPTMYHKKEDGK